MQTWSPLRCDRDSRSAGKVLLSSLAGWNDSEAEDRCFFVWLIRSRRALTQCGVASPGGVLDTLRRGASIMSHRLQIAS